jgi:hypothetical protein
MRRRELPEYSFAVGRQGEIHLTAIGGIWLASCQPVRDQAPGQLHRAVVLDLQSLGQLANRHAITLRKALDRQLVDDALTTMLRNNVGRLPVVSRSEPSRLVGYLGRATILAARLRRIDEEHTREPGWLSRSTAEPTPGDMLSSAPRQ